MTDTPKKKSKQTDESAPSRLLRSREDRIVAGVAAGLAEQLRIDSTLVRIAFVVAAFFGGIGILAYVVLAAITPENDGLGNPVPKEETGTHPLVRIAIAAVIALVAISAASAIGAASAWTVATGLGAIPAIAVIALGVAVAVLALSGRRYAQWLVVPALVIALPAGAIAASGIRFESSVGDRNYSPVTAGEIPDDGYSLGVGQLTVDLRSMRWEPDQTVSLDTDLGAGQTVISVPERICVRVDASAAAGELYLRGQRSSGLNPEHAVDGEDITPPTLLLHSRVDLGQLVVTDRDPGEFNGKRNGDHDGSSPEEDAQERADASEACRA